MTIIILSTSIKQEYSVLCADLGHDEKRSFSVPAVDRQPFAICENKYFYAMWKSSLENKSSAKTFGKLYRCAEMIDHRRRGLKLKIMLRRGIIKK